MGHREYKGSWKKNYKKLRATNNRKLKDYRIYIVTLKKRIFMFYHTLSNEENTAVKERHLAKDVVGNRST